MNILRAVWSPCADYAILAASEYCSRLLWEHKVSQSPIDVENEIGVYLFIEIYSSHNLFTMGIW